MDVTREMFTELLRDRFHLVGIEDENVLEAKVQLILAETSRFLEDGLEVNVQILMGHDGCNKASDKELCPALQRLELWSFKIQRGHCHPFGRLPIAPPFLRQALRSQLHFSPLRSWLAARPNTSEQPTLIVRVSTCVIISDWLPIPERIQSHQFPLCRVHNGSSPSSSSPSTDIPLWLQMNVHWLRKEFFAGPAHCPLNRGECTDDLWVVPPTECAKNDDSESDLTEGGCQTGQSHSSHESLGQKRKAEKNSGEEEFDDERTIWTGDNKDKTTVMVEDGAQESASTHLSVQLRRSNSPWAWPPQSSPTVSRSPEASTPASANPQTSNMGNGEQFEMLPTSSLIDNVPKNFTNPSDKLQRTQKREEDRIISRLGKFDSQNMRLETRTKMPGDCTPFRRWHRSTGSSRLVCNFEETVLSGRLVPSNAVNGYCLQLTVISPQSMGLTYRQMTFPAQSYFFDQISDCGPFAKAPSSLHLARCEIGTEGILIYKHCTLQAVLFNPQGSVVKLFMVDVDVRDMPPNSTTFIRQRTFSGSETKEDGQQLSSPVTSRTQNLRFLIHLRLVSDCQVQVRLHTDIRMLFSNKANDLDGLESVLGNSSPEAKPSAIVACMHSVAEMPDRPKYSPIK